MDGTGRKVLAMPGMNRLTCVSYGSRYGSGVLLYEQKEDVYAIN